MKQLLFLLCAFSFVGCDPGPNPGCAETGVDGGLNCPKEFCGGIAGFPCPGAGTCVDDPSDDCDPQNGGADCGGMCLCNVLASCVEGYRFDPSPSVCGCVRTIDPCATVRCAAGTHCEATDGRASCVPDVNPCAAVLCLVGSTCIAVDGVGYCVSVDPEPCGSVTCARGEVCCNASCGTCTPPGGACIQIACE